MTVGIGVVSGDEIFIGMDSKVMRGWEYSYRSKFIDHAGFTFAVSGSLAVETMLRRTVGPEDSPMEVAEKVGAWVGGNGERDVTLLMVHSGRLYLVFKDGGIQEVLPESPHGIGSHLPVVVAYLAMDGEDIVAYRIKRAIQAVISRDASCGGSIEVRRFDRAAP